MRGRGGVLGGDRLADATRMVHAGRAAGAHARTVGPPIEKGSTVLLPDAASLYDERQPTYGRGGLATQDALMAALIELESAAVARLFPLGPGRHDWRHAGGAEGGRRGSGHRRDL